MGLAASTADLPQELGSCTGHWTAPGIWVLVTSAPAPWAECPRKGWEGTWQSWDRSWYFQDLKGVYKKEVERLFTQADNDRERGDVFKLKVQQSRLDIKEKD